MCTCLLDVLHLGVCNGETQLLGFLLQDGVVDKLLPNLILHLVEFLLREVVATLGHLDDVLVLVNE